MPWAITVHLFLAHHNFSCTFRCKQFKKRLYKQNLCQFETLCNNKISLIKDVRVIFYSVVKIRWQTKLYQSSLTFNTGKPENVSPL